MPKLAVFPKAYMQALCKDGSMRLLNGLSLLQILILMDWNGMQVFWR